MPINQALLPEFDYEMANTRKTLERVPEDKFTWKPHEKSGTMGWLASHVATLPSLTLLTLEKDSFEVPPGYRPPVFGSRKELLDAFDKNVIAARAAIVNAGDAELMRPWSLVIGGKTLFTLPRVAVLRGFVMNHLIHHRAQLTVYLRLNNVPVPALYGPSADESPT